MSESNTNPVIGRPDMIIKKNIILFNSDVKGWDPLNLYLKILIVNTIKILTMIVGQFKNDLMKM